MITTFIGLLVIASSVSMHTEPPADASAGRSQPTQAIAVDISPAVNEAIINAPPGEVWKVFSTPEGFKKLGVAKCEMELRVGGLIRTHYDPKGVLGDEGTIENMIIAYEPERMISTRIHHPPKGFPFTSAYKNTWSVITLTDLGDGRTMLRLAGLGYTADEESQKMRQCFLAGNGWTFKKLQAAFGGERPEPTRDVHAAAPLAPIEVSTLVARPRADVWSLLSTSAGWKAFMGVEARIEPVMNGLFEIEFGSDAPAGQRGSEGCRVLSVDPGRVLSFTWNAPPKFEFARGQRTWVVITLEEVNPALTRVRLAHHGFAELARSHAKHADELTQVRAYFDAAWPRVLGALREHAGAAASKAE